MLTEVTDLNPQQKPSGALLTRREAAEFIRHDLGRPMSFSTMTKVCALGEGPPVADYWGRRPLYSREGLQHWAETRGRKPLIPPAPEAQSAPHPTPRKRGRPPKARSAGDLACDSAATDVR